MVLQLAARVKSPVVNVRCQMTLFPKKQRYDIYSQQVMWRCLLFYLIMEQPLISLAASGQVCVALHLEYW